MTHDLLVLPDIAVGSDGPVLPVNLVSQRPSGPPAARPAQIASKPST